MPCDNYTWTRHINPIQSQLPLNPTSSLRDRIVLWTPCVAMLFLSFISLVDRSILGILSPVMLQDLHLSASQYGAAIFVFSICYMLANPIWGYWMDRLGLFTAIALAVALWSLASGAHAFVSGFIGLCLARGLLGFGEGATFPAGLKAVTETLPTEKRSFGLGLAYSGGSLGALLTPIAIVPLSLHYGWRSTFLLSAVAGFLWIAGWFLLRSVGLYRPLKGSDHQRKELLPSSTPSIPKWNRNLFATAAIYGLGAAPLAFGLYSAPLYLTRVLHQPQSVLGHLLWIPPAGWEVGYLFWGRIADRRRKQAALSGKPSSPFALFALFAAGSTALCLIPYCAQLPSAVILTVALFFFVMFLSGGFVVITLAHGATTQPAESTGFLAGFSISGWSFTTGVLMWIVGRMFDRGEFTATFWLVSAFPLAGLLAWKLLTPRATPAPAAFSSLTSL
jgi:ACS family hexuronate transporter-like MFS transporter